MKLKAAGLWVSLALSLAPALILWLQDAQSAGVLTATFVGIAVVAINAVVKVLQVYIGETPSEFNSRSLGSVPVSESKRSKLLNG